MSQQFTLPPGCGGVTMSADQTRYAADATGHITVDNPRHIDEIATKAARYIHRRLIGFGERDGERCACGFLPHRFSTTCSHCGRDLKE